MYKNYKYDISAARDDTATLYSFYCTKATNRTPQQQEMILQHDVASTCTRTTNRTPQQQEMILLRYVATTVQELQIGHLRKR